MQYDRTVLGYHGCDADVAERLLAGDAFVPSANAWDWLGTGAYFWEYGPDRAGRFAEEQRQRGSVKTPAVVGALIQLGRCFDLLDTRYAHDLAKAYQPWRALVLAGGLSLPTNSGRTPERKLRRLDCAVLDWYLTEAHRNGDGYDTVRGGFTEGGPLFQGSGIQRETHIQIAVRNPRCIVGVFRPRMDASR